MKGCDATLDLLLPLHARLDAAGRVVHAGPALRRLAGDRALIDRPATCAFRLHRPPDVATAAELFDAAGQPLRLSFAEGVPVQLSGLLALRGEGGILNLALGLSELENLGRYGMTCTDFAPTDMTVDMVYLIEANSAIMDEARQLITRLQAAQAAAEERALTDTLTGLKNRRALDHLLAGRVLDGRSFALTQIDLDLFKEVNDTLGHAAGDHVLQTVARRIQETVREGDHVARIGGDEFVVLFEGISERAEVDGIARRLIARIEDPIVFRGETCRISASLGTTLSQTYASPEPARLLADADAALYRSKGTGRARHSFYDGGPSAVPMFERRRAG
ncbi:GGDEF domain-containing protein [Rhodobacteraceae bacterium CCMM004]|nr:GGDEF domain-containing protein [Rhodobacteraceae bacterium CCMM004]